MSVNITQFIKNINKKINNLQTNTDFQQDKIQEIIIKNKKFINTWYKSGRTDTSILLDTIFNNQNPHSLKLLIELLKILIQEGANPFIRSPLDNSSVIQRIVEQIEGLQNSNNILKLLEIVLSEYHQKIILEKIPIQEMHLKKTYYEYLQLHNITPNSNGEDILYQINNLKNNTLQKKLLILLWTPEMKDLSLHAMDTFFNFYNLISNLDIPIEKKWSYSEDNISEIVEYKMSFKNSFELLRFKNKIHHLNSKKIIIKQFQNVLSVKYVIDKSQRWDKLFLESPEHCSQKSKALAKMSEDQNRGRNQKILQTNRTYFPYQNDFQQGAYFDQSDYTVGNVTELYHSIIYPSLNFNFKGTKIISKLIQPLKDVIKIMNNLFFKSKVYQNIHSKSAHNTIHYMFKYLKKGIFVVIKNNYLESFVPFSRANFTNFYYPSLFVSKKDKNDLFEMYECEKELNDLDINGKDVLEYQKHLEKLLVLEERCIQNLKEFFKNNKWFPPRDILWNRRKWLANNHFLKPEFWEGDKDVAHYRFLLEELVQRTKLEGRTLPDAIFCLNLRDFPVLKVDETLHKIKILNPYPAVTEAYNNTLLTLNSSMIPILSHSGHQNYHDIPLPTTDDIDYHSQRFFVTNKNNDCGSSNQIDITDLEWKTKIGKAVFRGTVTGDGVIPETNIRLRATNLANHHPELFDVGVTNMNDKKIRVNSAIGLHRINKKELLSKYNIDRSSRLELVERHKYKYNLCLDGHTRADRFGNEMRLKNIMILPDSGHFLWFEPFMHPIKWNGKETITFLKEIKKGTHFLIDIDLKHLVSLIEWCKNHDKECQIIVNNMVKFHKTFLDRKSSFMYEYMEGIIRCISNNCVNQPFQLSKSIQPKSHLVGIVVGYRGTVSREVQLIKFMKFMNRYRDYVHIVIAEQYDNHRWLNNDNPFNIWWNSIFKDKREIHSDDFIKHYQNSNLDKDVPNIKINCNLAGGIRNILDKKMYNKSEYETKLIQSKFNLGLLKNIGFHILQQQVKSYHKILSHVVFIDIDILPDTELETFMFRKPPSNSVISLATRGTAYDHFALETMTNERFSRVEKKYNDKKYKQQSKKILQPTQYRFKPNFRPKSLRNKQPFYLTIKHKKKKYSKKHKGGNQNKLSSWVINKLQGKYTPFLGAAISFDINLFKKINGYPNHFWGWGGEDDALIYRIVWLSEKKGIQPIIYVPSGGRLIDLEATPNLYQVIKDKTSIKNKEPLKWEKMESLKNNPEGLQEITQKSFNQKTFKTITMDSDNHSTLITVNPFFENALLYHHLKGRQNNKNEMAKKASLLIKKLN